MTGLQSDIWAELDCIESYNRNGSRKLVAESVVQLRKLIRAELDALEFEAIEARNQ